MSSAAAPLSRPPPSYSVSSVPCSPHIDASQLEALRAFADVLPDDATASPDPASSVHASSSPDTSAKRGRVDTFGSTARRDGEGDDDTESLSEWPRLVRLFAVGREHRSQFVSIVRKLRRALRVPVKSLRRCHQLEESVGSDKPPRFAKLYKIHPALRSLGDSSDIETQANVMFADFHKSLCDFYVSSAQAGVASVGSSIDVLAQQTLFELEAAVDNLVTAALASGYNAQDTLKELFPAVSNDMRHLYKVYFQQIVHEICVVATARRNKTPTPSPSTPTTDETVKTQPERQATKKSLQEVLKAATAAMSRNKVTPDQSAMDVDEPAIASTSTPHGGSPKKKPAKSRGGSRNKKTATSSTPNAASPTPAAAASKTTPKARQPAPTTKAKPAQIPSPPQPPVAAPPSYWYQPPLMPPQHYYGGYDHTRGMPHGHLDFRFPTMNMWPPPPPIHGFWAPRSAVPPPPPPQPANSAGSPRGGPMHDSMRTHV